MKGKVILRYGLRKFFMGGEIWEVMEMMLWI